MLNPTMLNSDDELAKIAVRIAEAQDDLEEMIQAMIRELHEAQKDSAFLVECQALLPNEWESVLRLRDRLTGAIRLLKQCRDTKRGLMECVMEYAAEAGAPMEL